VVFQIIKYNLLKNKHKMASRQRLSDRLHILAMSANVRQDIFSSIYKNTNPTIKPPWHVRKMTLHKMEYPSGSLAGRTCE